MSDGLKRARAAALSRRGHRGTCPICWRRPTVRLSDGKLTVHGPRDARCSGMTPKGEA